MRMGILTPTKWLLDLTVGLEIWEYSTRTGKLNQSCIPWSSLQPFPGGLTYISYGDSRRKIKIKPLKAGFHERRSRSRSRSRNQKRRTYDLVKTAFRFRLRLRRLRSAYDLVKTRLSESEAEAEEPNQSQSVGTCIVIGLSFRFCFRLRQSGFTRS